MAVPGKKPQNFTEETEFQSTDRLPFVKDTGGGTWKDSYIANPNEPIYDSVTTPFIGNVDDKTSNSIRFLSASGSSSIDQSQLVTNATSVEADQWQSVTNGIDGLLDKVTIQNNSGVTATSVIVTIYEGIGSGGTVLSQVTGITAPHSTLTDVILSTKPFFEVTDTFTIGVTGTNFDWAINTAGGYGGGSFKGGVNDAIFKTFIDLGKGLLLTQSGINTISNQPYFMANVTSFPTNVTGDGTMYTVIYNNEITDRDSTYDNTTGINTVKTEGIHHYSFGVHIKDFTSTPNRVFAEIMTSNFTYQFNDINPTVVAGSGTLFFLNGSLNTEMDIGDTCQITVRALGGTLTVDINTFTGQYFTGGLLF